MTTLPATAADATEGKDTQLAPGGSTPTMSIRDARTTVLVAFARALREQPTAAQLLSGIDELGEAVICEDLEEIAAWADALAALAGIDTALGTAAEQPLRVYRAEHASIPLGTYTTEASARAHAEDVMSSEFGPERTVTYDWIGDEDDPDGWWELVVQIDGGDEQPTGYVVIPIAVGTAYDPDAE
ncbi:hypothetical protein [Streptomyces microflavus]|uniref:hypothetical protein n=1 Tax=Streptomyces microflavus TaxID=1919 RepID=UPI0037FE69B3